MIFITSDTHGPTALGSFDINGYSRRLNMDSFPEQREMTRDDYVIICGDFGGVWNYDSRYDKTKSAFKDAICLDHGESKEEKYWLDWLEKKNFTILFCDGNHENFDRLEKAYPEVDYCGGKAHRLRENVFHLERGYIFNIDGASFFVFGGAGSHDISGGILYPHKYSSEEEFKEEYRRKCNVGASFRIDHISWWERELPSEEEMNRGLKNLGKCGNKVDFVITHCGPQSVTALMGYTDSNRLTKYLQEVSEKIEFKKWFFGHYHTNRQILGNYIELYEQIVQIR